jgi:hypothetical protein
MNKLVNGLLRIVLAIGSFVFWILSFKAVRGWLWNKAEVVGKEKIVDAKAKVVKKK